MIGIELTWPLFPVNLVTPIHRLSSCSVVYWSRKPVKLPARSLLYIGFTLQYRNHYFNRDNGINKFSKIGNNEKLFKDVNPV